MPKLKVIAHDTVREIHFSPGVSLGRILTDEGMGIRSFCSGNGACGLCLVRVTGGEIGEPGHIERLILTPGQLKSQVRLACQVFPGNDLSIEIISASDRPDWHDMEESRLVCTPAHLSGIDSAEREYGLAVDLGTTNLSLSLWNLRRGSRISCRTGPNPQAYYGADVVTRLVEASKSPAIAGRLARMPLDSIREELKSLCSKDGCAPGEVTDVSVVGNTAMLTLLAEADSRMLLNPDSWTGPIEYEVNAAPAWRALLGIHNDAEIRVIPPLAGFVGSDLLAGVIATGLTDSPGSLLIDFGTNSEIALWDGSTLHVTSAAGGPAFESYGPGCAMPAEPGAIFQVDWKEDSRSPGFEVIGGGYPKGLCGSGLVDLIAILRRRGILSSTGRLNASRHGDGFDFPGLNPTIRLTAKHIDMFQRAKGAIGAGISAILKEARMSSSDLNRVCVCGAFGQYLNVSNAISIGLLPDVSPGGISLCGNAALAGCERLLQSGPEKLEMLRDRAAIINMSRAPDFEELFMENLYLQPVKMD